MVGMWFQIDIERAPASFLSRLLESENFGMSFAIVRVCARSHDAAIVVGNHCADIRIRGCESDPLAREIERLLQKLLVGGVILSHSMMNWLLYREMCEAGPRRMVRSLPRTAAQSIIQTENRQTPWDRKAANPPPSHRPRHTGPAIPIHER